MSHDDELTRAARALREAKTGTHPSPDETFQRVLETLDRGAPSASRAAALHRPGLRRTVVRSAIALAAALAMTTAWAAKSGRLPWRWATVESKQPSPRPIDSGPRPTEPPSAPVNAPAVANTEEPELPPEAATRALPEAPQTPAPSPRSSKLTLPPRTRGVEAATEDQPPLAPAQTPEHVAPVDETDALFARANRLHFDGDYAGALVAWDTYLRAAPQGRFAPEAQFNRAIALWKLGRKGEAKAALEPFARGAYGDYRRDEARRLLGAPGD